MMLQSNSSIVSDERRQIKFARALHRNIVPLNYSANRILGFPNQFLKSRSYKSAVMRRDKIAMF